MNNNNNPHDEFTNIANNENNFQNEIYNYGENLSFNDFTSEEIVLKQEDNINESYVVKPKKLIDFLNMTKMFTVVSAFVVTVAVVAIVLSASSKIVSYLFGDDYLSYEILISDINEEEIFISVSNAYFEEKRIAKEGLNTGFFENLKPNTYYYLKVEGTSQFGYKTYESIRFKTTYEKPKALITNLKTILQNQSQLISFDYIKSDKYESISDVSMNCIYGYSYQSGEETIEYITLQETIYLGNSSKNYTLDNYVQRGSFFKYHLEYYLNGELITTEQITYLVPSIPYVDVLVEILEDNSVLFNGSVEDIGNENLYLYVYSLSEIDSKIYKLNLNDYFIQDSEEECCFKSFTILMENLNSDIVYYFEIKGSDVYFNSWFVISNYFDVTNLDYLINANESVNLIFDFNKLTIPNEYNCFFGVDYIYKKNDEITRGRINFQNDEYIIPQTFAPSSTVILKFFQTINGINHYKQDLIIYIPEPINELPSLIITTNDKLYSEQTQQLSFEIEFLDPSNKITNVKLSYKIVYLYKEGDEWFEEVIIEEEIDIIHENQILLFADYISGGNQFKYFLTYDLEGSPIIQEETVITIGYIPSVYVSGERGPNDIVIIKGYVYNNPHKEQIILTIFNDDENYEFNLNDYLLPNVQEDEQYDAFEVPIFNLEHNILYNYQFKGEYIYNQDRFMISDNLQLLYKIEKVNIVEEEFSKCSLSVDIINLDFLTQISNIYLNYSYEDINGLTSGSIPIYYFTSNYNLQRFFPYEITVNIQLVQIVSNEQTLIDEKDIFLNDPNKYFEINNLAYYFLEFEQGRVRINFDFLDKDISNLVYEFGYDYIYSHPVEPQEGNIKMDSGDFNNPKFLAGGLLELKFYQVIESGKQYYDILFLEIR